MLSRHFKSLLSSPRKAPSLRYGGASASISDVTHGSGKDITDDTSLPLHLETFDVPRVELLSPDNENLIAETESGLDLLDPRYSTLVLTTVNLRDKLVTACEETARKISGYAVALTSEIGSGPKVDEPKPSTVPESGPSLATVKPFDKSGLVQKWESVKQQLPGWQTKIAQALQTVQDMITKTKGPAGGKKEEECSK